MKALVPLLISAVVVSSCCTSVNKEDVKQDIVLTEKAFEKMASDKGIAEAFYYFADENAVIHRENDTLIKGKKRIKVYYDKKYNPQTTVNWSPDFVELSADGTMAYTYGKYVWNIKNNDGTTATYKGIFHTVWKKQKDNSWKYVWD